MRNIPRTVNETNWAGNYAYRARAIHAPRSVDELRAFVRGASRLRVIGSRHSFTAIADSDELVTLDALPRAIAVAPDRRTVTVTGSVRYGELALELDRAGLALANLASLPHIGVAGAISTATHGSGDGNGNLARAVAALELMTSDGEVRRFARGDVDFDGMVVGLGAVGAILAVTLDVEPGYEVRQWVFDGLTWGALARHFEEVFAAGYSVSVFHRWGETTEQVWVKRRADDPRGAPPGDLFGAAAADRERHPIAGLDPVNCTPQLGSPGPWWDRLPHFRMGFTPSSGAEIQSEFLVSRAEAPAAIDALLGLRETLAPRTQVSEIRTVAADRLWMSPQYGQDTVGIHFTWVPDQAAVERALKQVEDALEPFGARPHWGKLFMGGAERIRRLYPRVDEFEALCGRLDPRGVFRNEWLEKRVLTR
jgi:xylitol oxidase